MLIVIFLMFWVIFNQRSNSFSYKNAIWALAAVVGIVIASNMILSMMVPAVAG